MLAYSEYPPKIRARAKRLASKLYDPKSLDLDAPENQKSREQIESVLVLYCEEAKKTLKQAAEEAQINFQRAKQVAIDAARAAEDASDEARAVEAEGDEPSDDEE